MFRLVCFVRVHFPILAQSTTLRSCRPAAVQSPSSSSLQLSARLAAVVAADCFDRSLRCATRLCADTSLLVVLLLLLLSSAIYVRSQMTDSRQHADSTTLQPCRTASAVGNTIYVRVACPRYAAASCSRLSLTFVTPTYYHTFLLYIGTFKNRNTWQFRY